MTQINFTASSTSEPLREQERGVLVQALAAARSGTGTRAALAELVCAADETGLFTYGEIAELIGMSWLEVPKLVLEAPRPASRRAAGKHAGRRRRSATMPRTALAG